MDAATAETVELLQTLIRNRCVNDGRPESGQEVRNADVLQTVIEGAGIEVERFEPTPGRVSIVGRIGGSDPDAPSLCLMGHTDVVPVHEEGWREDPFGGELIDGEVWGRGAVDMLNITASMAVVVRRLADSGFRPLGDLIYFAVADEEAGSAHGARWMADHHPEAIRADYVLTENGGIHSGPADAPSIGVNVGERGVAWRRLTVRGTPGHGSMPFRKDNALVTASQVVARLAEYRPSPVVTELWRERVDTMNVPDDLRAALLDPARIDDVLDDLPSVPAAAHLHACTHTTFSPNLVDGEEMKVNVIPDKVIVEVDVRTLPGEGPDEVDAHLRAALGGLYDVWLPMSYWSFRSDASGYGDGYAYHEESVRRLRSNLGDPEALVHGIGGIGGVDGIDDPPDPEEPLATLAEIERFAVALADTGSIGGSIYDWNTLEPTVRTALADLLGAGGAG